MPFYDIKIQILENNGAALQLRGNMPEVTLRDFALSEAPDGTQIVRGALTLDSIKCIKEADYQRERGPVTSIDEWKSSYRKGLVPDIFLGARGKKLDVVDGLCVIKAKVYVVDGLQRMTALEELMLDAVQNGGECDFYLGCAIRLGTNEALERTMFDLYNFNRKQVNANVRLRNMAVKVPLLYRLVRLTQDPEFLLQGRVTWTQSAKPGDLIGSLALVKTLGMLHSIWPGMQERSYLPLLDSLSALGERIGEDVLFANLTTFFGLIEQVWGIGRFNKATSATPHLKLTFFKALAYMLSHHSNFWDGQRLVIDDDQAIRFADFPFSEPAIKEELKSDSPKGRDFLALKLTKHWDGRRKKDLLEKREPMPTIAA
ncbi:MAG TPA: hypothetical protein VFO38_05585 [Candidatus Saccharimonadales bacterium]|nr:hypothetical protein [Candidatus Saccharimonadales bacterium]